jgi:hypothetical protein
VDFHLHVSFKYIADEPKDDGSFLIRFLVGNWFVLFSCDYSCPEVGSVCLAEMAFDSFISTSRQELFTSSCSEWLRDELVFVIVMSFTLLTWTLVISKMMCVLLSLSSSICRIWLFYQLFKVDEKVKCDKYLGIEGLIEFKYVTRLLWICMLYNFSEYFYLYIF